MPMLEEGFELLYWPRLVREYVNIREHPGYRPEFFRTYLELDAFFSQECGPDWRNQDWAKFWFDQHAESKRKDREENTPVNLRRATRNSSDSIYLDAKNILEKSPQLSVRKLTYTLCRLGYSISKSSVAKFIKRFKDEKN